jgi:hypothetical protein
MCRYRTCDVHGVLRYSLPRTLLVVVPLAISAGRFHIHTVATPVAATQEVNRCLTLVRIAASRRRDGATTPQRRSPRFSLTHRRSAMTPRVDVDTFTTL